MTDYLHQIGADLRAAAERRLARRRRTRLVRGTVAVCAAALAIAIVVAGPSLLDRDREAAGERTQQGALHVPAPAAIACDVGAEPGYFVPGDGPAALLGCARLPVSGLRMELSANTSRFDAAETLCINPAYGHGAFIPGICRLDPPVSAFSVRAAGQPRQAVDGYAYVVWGTAGGAGSVSASFDGGVADALRVEVPADLARRFDHPPFALFVAELPLSAACGPVTVEGGGQTAHIAPKPRAPGVGFDRRLCERR